MKFKLEILIPLFLCAVGILMLMGCIPLPFPERQVNPAQKNITRMFGDAASRETFRTGRATKQEILKELGPAQYASRDGNSLGYTLNVSVGFVIYPLCFMANEFNSGQYAVRLDFDDHGVLASWKLVRHAAQWGPQVGAGWHSGGASQENLNDLNASGSPLEPVP